ncbi:sulfotransferase domain-containing protein [Dongia mobilis]|uniref:Sulfotransferase domain-containing protein n=1 Tax=Dongia mobilis TaxID=578943 RepID=A0A4R6WR30_9PROT|nr:sulfotransferase domain-containing protein [Dongia mobilis]TDQ81977.1 sulfotransferase domain-containing protein [Dongia mobilis]
MGKILWLASYPKSGNTWLRAFIHNLLRQADPKAGAAPVDINDMNRLTTGDSLVQWFRHLDPRPPLAWSRQDVAAMRRGAQLAMMASKPGTVIAKTHNALLELHGHPTINMDLTAGAIYVVRNPLDLVISLADHYGVDIDKAIEVMGDTNNGGLADGNIVFEIHSSWSVHVKSWTHQAHPGLHVVRYEDMLAKPREAFGGIARFMGLNPPRDKLEKAIELSSFKNLRQQEEAKGFQEKSQKGSRFFRVGKAGQWLETLTPAQIERIVAQHQEQMARFGYWPLPGARDSARAEPAGEKAEDIVRH